MPNCFAPHRVHILKQTTRSEKVHIMQMIDRPRWYIQFNFSGGGKSVPGAHARATSSADSIAACRYTGRSQTGL